MIIAVVVQSMMMMLTCLDAIQMGPYKVIAT